MKNQTITNWRLAEKYLRSGEFRLLGMSRLLDNQSEYLLAPREKRSVLQVLGGIKCE